MLAALLSIPILIRTIGDSRFGFLSIAWMLIGYFGLFDLGIGRAMTHGVSKRLAHDPTADISDLVWTGLFTLGIIGTLAGLAIAYLSNWLVFSIINIQSDLRLEAAEALVILSLAVPFVILSSGLRGVLEAKHDFKSINLVVMPLGIMLFLGPLIVIQFSVALPYLILSLLVVRLATFLALFLLCFNRVRGFLTIRLSKSTLRELLSFGGWMTVSNVVSPLMVNMDRLFVGSLMSVSAVTYYVTPFEIVTKLLVLPGSIANACFPEFARLHKLNSHEATLDYLLKTLKIVLLLLVPSAFLVGVLAHDLLRLWISADLADRSAGIMRLLAAGIIINGLSYIPFAYIQGIGRSDITARFHLLELLVYVPTLYLMTVWLGLTGVALSWVFRVLMDAFLLFGYAAMQIKGRFQP